MIKFLWLPIHNAPKDGRKILACGKGGSSDWRYDPITISFRTFHPNAAGKATWRDVHGHKVEYVTHWMPLPERPDEPIERDTVDEIIDHLCTAIKGTVPDKNPVFEDAFTEKHWWNKVRNLVGRLSVEEDKLYRLPLREDEKYCHCSRDGEVCTWYKCPQKEDGEPEKSGRHCPLDHEDEEG